MRTTGSSSPRTTLARRLRGHGHARSCPSVPAVVLVLLAACAGAPFVQLTPPALPVPRQPLDLEPWCNARSAAQSAADRALESALAGQLRLEGVPRPRKVARLLARDAARHELDPILVLAIIEVESGYRAEAKSPRGALGLLQLQPETAREVALERGLDWRGPATLLEPEANVRMGILYLSKLLDRFPDLEHALAAYNQGPGAVSRALAGGRTVPRAYVERVRQTYTDLDGMLAAIPPLEPADAADSIES